MQYKAVWNKSYRYDSWQLLATVAEGQRVPRLDSRVDLVVVENGSERVYRGVEMKSKVFTDKATGLSRFYCYPPLDQRKPPPGVKSSSGDSKTAIAQWRRNQECEFERRERRERRKAQVEQRRANPEPGSSLWINNLLDQVMVPA